ncbi:hypothetical protein EDD85DRAFT_792661 [Armillaria nabsnona]|nr:hypothetical protein EDD85DRAFT_792661 [Armillaria nabsnona]
MVAAGVICEESAELSWSGEGSIQRARARDSPSIRTAREFANIIEYDAGTEVVRFKSLQLLEIDEACVAFPAKLNEAHGEEQVVVKLLASKRKAPALKYCGPISSNGKYWYYSLQMAVMEFLRGPTVAQKEALWRRCARRCARRFEALFKFFTISHWFIEIFAYQMLRPLMLRGEDEDRRF